MIRLALTLIVLALSATCVEAQEEKLRLTSEADFGLLLAGCWADSWHAQFADGTEGGGSTTICFEQAGRILIDAEGDSLGGGAVGRGEGTYKFGNDRLYLNKGASSGAWPFQRELINCDAAIRPDQSLELTNCIDNDTGADGGAYSFGRFAEQ